MEESYFSSATLLRVRLLHGCFPHFEFVQMVPNRATHLIYGLSDAPRDYSLVKTEMILR